MTSSPSRLCGMAAASSASSLQKFLFIVAERSQAPNVRACQGTRVAAAGPVTRGRRGTVVQAKPLSLSFCRAVILSFIPSVILPVCQSESLKVLSAVARFSRDSHRTTTPKTNPFFSPKVWACKVRLDPRLMIIDFFRPKKSVWGMLSGFFCPQKDTF